MNSARPQDPKLDTYAASRRTEKGAESYSTKYDDEFHKRISQFFERRVIRKAVSMTGLTSGRVLDCPCGAGRLSPLLRDIGAPLISADYSPTMLGVFQTERGTPCFVGDAFNLPFEDQTFDLVFSARLSHHIGDDELRRNYVREILRISRKWVIMTIFDTRSLKNRLRQLRSTFSKKRPKSTLTREQVAELAAAAGYTLRGALPLSRLASGHIFYVLERT